MLPIQTGTGDPSPENIRPIYGHTSATAHRTGKNLLTWPNLYRPSVYGVTFEIANGVLTAVGTAAGGSPQPFNSSGYSNYEEMPFGPFPAGTYTITQRGWPTVSAGTTATTLRIAARYADGSSVRTGAYYDGVGQTFTATEPFKVGIWANIAEGETVDYSVTIQMEAGNTVTDYEPYRSNTYTLDFGQTVYGGTLDFITGVLTATWGYIASYNGETLPAEWISDRDVYAAGTTPTTGAAVAYKLATPQTIQVTPQEITTLLGTNNIWVTTTTNQP